MSLRKYLARIKREIFKKPFLKDPKFPPYLKFYDNIKIDMLAVNKVISENKKHLALY
jgi:hypothetical protein